MGASPARGTSIRSFSGDLLGGHRGKGPFPAKSPTPGGAPAAKGGGRSKEGGRKTDRAMTRRWAVMALLFAGLFPVGRVKTALSKKEIPRFLSCFCSHNDRFQTLSISWLCQRRGAVGSPVKKKSRKPCYDFLLSLSPLGVSIFSFSYATAR